MKIKKKVLELLATFQGLALIMSTLNVSHSTARNYVQNNDESLTKAAMLKAIREKFGLTDNQILEEPSKKVSAR